MNKVMDVLIDMIREEKQLAHECYQIALVSRNRGEYKIYNEQLVEYQKHTYSANTLRSVLDRLQD